MISNRSSLDCLGLEADGKNNDNLVKDHVGNAESDNVKQKNLFYQLIKVYQEVNSPGGIVRPLPVLLGDGQLLDLYKLFSLVKERGGYAAVSRKGSWSFVTKELGLDLQVLASVKLAYDKYLNDFEAWVKKTFEEKIIRNRNHGYGWSFKPFPLEIEKELSALLCLDLKEKDDELDIKEKDDELDIKEKDDELDIKEKDDELDIKEKDDELDIKEGDNELELKSKKNRRFIDLLVNHKNETKLLDTNNQNNICEDVQNVHVVGVEKLCSGDKYDLATLHKEDVEKEYNNRKRKRVSLSGMLNWMKHIAKHPLVPVTPPLPKPSKWKGYKGDDFFSLLLRAREVLLLKQCVEPNGGPTSLQNQKMHPSMYEDEVARDHHSTARLKCSGRQATSVKSRLCSCCNSRSADENRLTSSVNKEAEKCPPKKIAKVDLLTAKIMAKKSGDKVFEKGNVSIGPRYQAEVPEWTGVVSESDSKWDGTQVWPPPEQDSEAATKTDLIGREREYKCSCEVIGSVQCHRFHIAENRMKLKLELGPLFYHWGFDRMGEEVSLQWTTVEEKKFKELLRLHAPIWNNTSIYFPKKKRRNLVNYYFNDFVIQLRSYQNRVTPNSVDSDDDEAEFGSFGHGFGMETLMVDDVLPECSMNKQCTDFEY
ncbi:hypothetical protein Lal_00041437 [Lupinus albus]|uniref:Putative transcription factor & chromatin remodeling ARID family n=1 Tax=Lupinus albus TaxID=3870 RepID=A0A6A4P7G4_LUPAL|nr:putative transcription factor & chromatin remodeling ARID family [Lupinus albus]KAF1873997.1 hypothetical protein Lal_00041437 [Lupinus albus]